MAGKVYLLRTCAADMTAYGGFKWPESGPVKCPDWDPRPHCGNGLHGLRNGAGDGSHLSFAPDAKWLVVEADEDVVVDLIGKVKIPEGVVVHTGDRKSATEHIIALGTATAGDYGTATAGYRGTATAGEGGTATAGDYGTATAGEGGTATAGYRGTATAGNHGTATAGYRGTATAGEGGELRVRWWDSAAGRYRAAIGYVGEGGVKADTAYRVRDGQLVEAANG